MKPIILAVSGASAQILAERSLKLLLNSGENVELIISKGAFKVWQSEYQINIPIDPQKQIMF